MKKLRAFMAMINNEVVRYDNSEHIIHAIESEKIVLYSVKLDDVIYDIDVDDITFPTIHLVDLYLPENDVITENGNVRQSDIVRLLRVYKDNPTAIQFIADMLE